jgi:hypothetical protein
MKVRKELDKLVDKAMNDPKYLERLLASPKDAAKELGVDLTAEEIAQIKPLSLRDASDLLENKRAGC